MTDSRNKYEAVIGLEVHAQLKTKSKIFCNCPNLFGKDPNTLVCPVCLGLPGVLPVLNKKAVEYSIKTALALKCRVAPFSIFARKNYFYPDLPKGYQISQFEEPLSENGYLEIEIDGNWKKIRIKRIHMEEDAGKLIHPEGDESVSESKIDINRCGVPLIEIVSEPDITTPVEAHLYLKKLKQVLSYLDISDCNMEEGSLRCDANVSIRKKGEKSLGVKTEVKNLNSFKNVEKALDFEINRQKKILEQGGHILQETLYWDARKNQAFIMRRKEYSDDYRYFPEPDLIPLKVSTEWIEKIRKTIPELPNEKKKRLIKQYNIPSYNAEILIDSKELADYFEKCTKFCSDYRTLSNWIIGDVLYILNEKKISITEFRIPPEFLGTMVKLIENKTISGKIAKEVFEEMLKTGKSPEDIVKTKNLIQLTDEDKISDIIETVLKENKEELEKYLNGKEKLFGFFIGQIMKKTRGKANPQIVNKLLKNKLDRLKEK
ncbi:Asp-tRNA(Asn)/Glu-tRNA(Gln) amidotransferase GatCAB subunit B [candidate division KSB1 bacterium]|nr:MAG: Asp-tRNA(Asn)/Glu-tRNA(Gln) amidotransferase GatCAB subunit B [candidate division KSB1 bacterium]